MTRWNQTLNCAVVVCGLSLPLWGQLPNPPFHVTPADPIPQTGTSGSQAPGGVPPPLSLSNWTLIGPASLAVGGPLFSGRIAGIAAHPSDSNQIYIAAASGGVWKTTNGGTSWTPLTDNQQTLATGAVAIAASNPNTIYAGTGEASNSADSQYGLGIMVSTDGGGIWNLNAGPGGIFATNGLTTAKIAVNPANANIAYAAMGNVGNNHAFSAGAGIYKTVNGGASWTNTTAGIGVSTDAWSDVAIDPTSPGVLYAALGSYFGSVANGVYKSINSGASWSLLSAFPNGPNAGRISIAIAPSNSQIVYVSAAGNTGTTGSGVYQVIRSDTAGATGVVVTPVNYMGGQGWYDQAIAVDPANPALVYVSGASGANSILRSTNSGGSWVSIAIAAVGTTPHADHHALAFDASGRLLDGDDGGIFRFDSASPITWADLNSNLSTLQFIGIATHPTDPSIAVGGTQDNGTSRMTSGNVVWTATDGGDGGLVRFSRQTPANLLRVSPVGSFGVGDFIRKSTNTGASWTSAVSGVNGSDTQNFYPSLTMDPTNGNHALLGTNKIYETVNFAANWSALGTTGLGTTEIDAIAIAPSDPSSTFYVAQGGFFSTDNTIFVTTNHGTSWVNRDIPVAGRVSDIAVDASSTSIAYAVISTFNSTSHVYKTTNTGSAWTAIGTAAAGLPDLPTWSIRKDPATGYLFVGNDNGVYISKDEGASWTRFAAGLPSVQVLDLDLNSNLGLLGAGTHGRSMWEIQLPALPAVIVTSQFTISNFVPTYNRTSAKWIQTVTLTNNGSALSNVAYVLDSLNPGWTLTNGDGTTSTTTPAGSPYKVIGVIGVGQSVTFSLQFTRVGAPTFGYTPRVLEGTSR